MNSVYSTPQTERAAVFTLKGNKIAPWLPDFRQYKTAGYSPVNPLIITDSPPCFTDCKPQITKVLTQITDFIT